MSYLSTIHNGCLSPKREPTHPRCHDLLIDPSVTYRPCSIVDYPSFHFRYLLCPQRTQPVHSISYTHSTSLLSLRCTPHTSFGAYLIAPFISSFFRPPGRDTGGIGDPCATAGREEREVWGWSGIEGQWELSTCLWCFIAKRGNGVEEAGVMVMVRDFSDVEI